MNFEDQSQDSRHDRSKEAIRHIQEIDSVAAEEIDEQSSEWNAVENSSKLDEEEMIFLGRIKVDLDTTLEKALSYATGAMLFGAYMCLHIAVFGGKRSPPDPAYLKGLPYFLGLAALAFAMRRATDNYYVLDIRRKMVMYHFQFLSWESVEPAFRFNDVRRVVMHIETRRNKHSSWNEHQLRLYRSNGNSVEFSDWQKDGVELRQRGERLAKLFRRRFEIEDRSEIPTSLLPSTAADGSKVWFHLGSVPVTEHRFAVSLGIFCIFAVIVIAFLSFMD